MTSKRFRLLPADDARHAWLEDAGLLAGDRGKRVAEKGHVVDGDRRDRGGKRLVDHIGRIEPAAKSRLQQQQIGRRLGEGEEGRRRGDLEQGDQLAVIGGLGAGEAIDQHLLADRRGAIGTGKHDALVEVDEMRRGVDMHALAQRLGDGADEGEQRALAVGAGDMHHRRQAPLGMAERREQAFDAPERQIDRLRMQRLQPLKQRVACRDGRQWDAALVAVGQSGQGTWP